MTTSVTAHIKDFPTYNSLKRAYPNILYAHLYKTVWFVVLAQPYQLGFKPTNTRRRVWHKKK